MSPASISKFLLNFGCGEVEKVTFAVAGRSATLSRSRKRRLAAKSESNPLRLVSKLSMRSGCSMSASVRRRTSFTRRST